MTFPELFQAIEERRELMLAATEAVDASVQLLESVDDEIGDLDHLPERLHADDVERMSHTHAATLDEMAELEYHAAQKLDGEHTAFRHQLTDLHRTLEHGWEHIAEKQTQITIKMYEIETALLDLEDLLSELTFQLSMEFADHRNLCVELRERTMALGEATAGALAEFETLLGNDLFQSLDETFTGMRDEVDAISARRLPAATRNWHAAADRSFDELNQAAVDQAERLGAAVQDSAGALQDWIDRDVLDALDAMFRKLDREAIDEMARTMDQCAAIMGGGAAIAQAIQRWLPALKNIRDTVETVQHSAEAS